MNSTTDGAGPPARRPASVRTVARRVLLGAGVLSLLAGMVMFGYIGWRYQGTDMVANQRQADLVKELQASFRYPTVTDVLGPQSPVTRLGEAEALIRIPRFGADYEVPLIEGVRGQDLAKGIGHYPGTEPGQIGNFAVTAHRVTNGDAFRDLAKLRPGDEVLVMVSGVTYTYELDTDPNDLVVPFSDTWVIEDVPMPPNGPPPAGMPALESEGPTVALITLTSCAEIFHSDDRLVAFGHLTGVTAT